MSASVSIPVVQVRHGFSRGTPVYFDGSNWVLATTGAEGVGLVGNVTSQDSFEFTTIGEVRGLTDLIAGSTYYPDGSGYLSTTENGDPLGVAYTSTVFHVRPPTASSSSSTVDTSAFASQTQLAAEATARVSADVDLQSQIDALADIATTGSASDLIAGIVPDARMPDLTGDVTTVEGAVATTITPNAVTNTKLAQMPTMTIKGNDAGGAADPQDLTADEVATLLALTESDIIGLSAHLAAIEADVAAVEAALVVIDANITDIETDIAAIEAAIIAIEADVATRVPQARLINTTSPITGGGDLTLDRTIAFDQTIDLNNNARVAVEKAGVAVGERRTLNFIEGSNITLTIADDAGNEEVDITIAAAGGAGVADGDKGDITVSGSGATWTIDPAAVTFSQIQDVSTEVLIGRALSGSGSVQEVTIGGGISWNGAGGIHRSAITGDVSVPAGSNTATIAAQYWAKILNTAEVSVSAAGSATINRIHVVSGTSADYTITISGLSPVAGDVLAFRVLDYTAANKQYILDAGGTVKIAGRTRYLTLVHTNVVLLQWDGTDWQALVMCLDTPWVDAGVLSITAVTTNPTKGATDEDKVFWRRSGRDIMLDYTYRQSGAGTAGSGDYLFGIPIGTIDSSIVELNTGADGDAVRCRAVYGTFRCRTSGDTSPDQYNCNPYSTTTFRLQNPSARIYSANRHLNNSATQYQGTTSFPITNW
jgi:hypothetical protein